MIRLTDAQLEFAAREYCARLGKDPDVRLSIPHPEGFAVALHAARWAIIADELKDNLLRLDCVNAALASEETHNGT